MDVCAVSKAMLCRRDGDVVVNLVDNQPLKYFRCVAEDGDWAVGGWFS